MSASHGSLPSGFDVRYVLPGQLIMTARYHNPPLTSSDCFPITLLMTVLYNNQYTDGGNNPSMQTNLARTRKIDCYKTSL